eukprot:755699-Hanusia_phi.AAC.2
MEGEVGRIRCERRTSAGGGGGGRGGQVREEEEEEEEEEKHLSLALERLSYDLTMPSYHLLSPSQ